MTVAGRMELPDPDAARRELIEARSEFAPRIAEQARAYAEAVRSFLESRWQGESTTKAATDLIVDIIGRMLQYSIPVGSWARDMSSFAESPVISEGLEPTRLALKNSPLLVAGGLLPSAASRQDPSGSEMRPILRELHEGLVTVTDSLTRPVPHRALLPVQHPPAFARLREDVVAETVTEQLSTLIDEGVAQYEAAHAAGGWPGSSPQSRLATRFASSLGSFLTTEVAQRYETATRGFDYMESTSGNQRYRSVAAGIHPRIYSAYVAIAVNYLAEVLEFMPAYAEASGQGKRRDPVTVYGNVGAINSEIANSQLSVADTVTSIGATINTVADRGQNDIAAALHALTEAIQQAQELAEGERAELLLNFADVADAAAAPDEPRRLARARAAIAMITTAAGASTQLAQAVDTWHQVAGQLF
ncbi:hypothetical protein [Streptomyces sp. NPDC017964]|uniref:hypothetical protein n=1 Tax=Streptomyces sp. NPDC017964 TaxID=3365022 RepID=UPI0037AAB656